MLRYGMRGVMDYGRGGGVYVKTRMGIHWKINASIYTVLRT